MHSLMHGEHERKIYEQCYRTGQPVPAKLANAPRLNMGLEFTYDAFVTLNTERSGMGMGIGPIPWSRIIHYAEFHRLTPSETHMLVFHVMAMDRAYIGHVTKRPGTPTPGTPTTKPERNPIGKRTK